MVPKFLTGVEPIRATACDRILARSLICRQAKIWRWVASALSDAKDRFRKLRGFRDVKLLIAALDQRVGDPQSLQLRAA